MHLKSLTLKGFKSFPDRTTLKFGPGTSVIVGPNGSGKSNITDAVLWVLGEQSPSAVRGRSMQDIIFSGGDGVQARSQAEVELVLDNSDGAVPIDFPEISILRRLDRSGEGEYRLNGSKCRLIDVLELLSETGLGKEMHSVISQGRVEAIVTSKPRDRRLLIEEAAGLGKHRKRRHRAQLKLNRTQENLDRALDVEREARSRLKPLKRQAEAAELHAQIERQTTEARWELQREAVREQLQLLKQAEESAQAAKAKHEQAEKVLAEVEAQRQAAEAKLAEHGVTRERLLAQAYSLRAAHERIGMRLERIRSAQQQLKTGERDAKGRLEQLAFKEASWPTLDSESRVKEIEAELAQLDRDRQIEMQQELDELSEQIERARNALAAKEGELAASTERLEQAELALKGARQRTQEAQLELDQARRDAAKVGGELAAANQFLRSHGTQLKSDRLLANELKVESGYEQALAAVLGHRLSAALVENIDEGTRILDQAGGEGGTAIVLDSALQSSEVESPCVGARPLLSYVEGSGSVIAVAKALLGSVWVVDSLGQVAPGFRGIAVTRSGRTFVGSTGELRQSPGGGEEKILAQRNRRDQLILLSEKAANAEQTAIAALEDANQQEQVAAAANQQAQEEQRLKRQAFDEAKEAFRRAEWTRQQREAAPDEGPGAVRRAELGAELNSLREVEERLTREREEHIREKARAEKTVARAKQLEPTLNRLTAALHQIIEHGASSVEALEKVLEEDRAKGDAIAAEMRKLAGLEAEKQAAIRATSQNVTHSEVAAQQCRDKASEAEAELRELATKLGLEATPAEAAMQQEQRDQLQGRLERLARRREQLGPVNPLAKKEYEEALAHVEELESQRHDLEGAIRELNDLIKETDRHIRETFEATFEATAKNFEDVVTHLFPGGKGRLSLVKEEGPKRTLGDADVEADADAEDEELEGQAKDERIGLEIELTPAGKTMKSLSLLSGGEKSLTALAFLFAVFITRPCPFYIMDEVEAALDDLNTGRFLDLLDRYRDRAQFIVVTHQKRTMEAADYLYGVSMAANGVSKVISRKLPRDVVEEPQAALTPQPA